MMHMYDDLSKLYKLITDELQKFGSLKPLVSNIPLSFVCCDA